VKLLLPNHEVKHAAESGLQRLRNGDLLREAAIAFDVMLTTTRTSDTSRI
jgi:hypothetical protein